jgi:hypothetical protein
MIERPKVLDHMGAYIEHAPVKPQADGEWRNPAGRRCRRSAVD